MMRRYVYIILLILAGFAVKSQNSLSFYHLGNATFQNNFYNPAIVPDGILYIGLPAISGVHLNYNNKFNYSDVIVNQESGTNQVDLDLYLESLQKNNMVSASTSISLLHLGFTTQKGLTLSVFANERVEFDFLYPKSLMEFVIKGNGAVTNETLEIGKTRANATYFREIGIGAAAEIPSLSMKVGIHAKYLQGFANASTPGNFTADLETDKVDYSISLDMQNATLRTAGFDVLQGNSGNLGSYMISNPNRGAAIDLGWHWDLNRYYAISASIVDLGFISWKEDIKNYHIEDTTFRYGGIDLQDIGDLEQTVEDSLINKFKDRKTENSDSYTTLTSPKVYGSFIYHVPGLNGDVISTAGIRYIQGQAKVLLGAGYTHRLGKFFVGSVNVTRLPQQFLNLGAAMAIKGGPAQLYLAVDQLVNYDLTKFQSIDVRVGLNFIIGKKEEKELPSAFANNKGSKRNKGEKTTINSFLGRKVRVKGKDGIYYIIEKQQRRSKEEYMPNSNNN